MRDSARAPFTPRLGVRARQRWLIGAVLVGAVLLAGLRLAVPSRAEIPAGQHHRVARGEISSTVRATGTLVPTARAQLAPAMPGRVGEVFVAPGDRVRAGQVLLALETTRLDAVEARAEADLRAAEARLVAAQAPPRTEEIALAESAVRVAEAALAGSLAGTPPAVVAAARARLAAAQSTLAALEAGNPPAEVRAAEEAVRGLWARQGAQQQQIGPAEIRAQEAQVERAAADLALAAASLARLRDQPAASALAPQAMAVDSARARLAAAQAQLDQPPSGPHEYAVAEAEAHADAARAKLAEERRRLERAHHGASAADVAAAEREVAEVRARLRSAQARQMNLLRPPPATELQAAQRGFNAAQLQVWVREEQLTGVLAAGPPSSGSSLAGLAAEVSASLFDESPAPSAPASSSGFAGVPNPIQLQQSEASVESTRQRLLQAQTRLEQLMRGPRASQVVEAQQAVIAAERALHTAEHKLEQLHARPRASDVAEAQTAVDVAAANVRAAEAKVELARANPQSATGAERERAVDLARVDLQAAEARLAQSRLGAPALDLLAAERERGARAAALQAAQLKLDSMRAGPPAAVGAEWEATLAQAEANVRAKQQPYTPEQLRAQQQVVAEAEAALRSLLAPQATGVVEQQREQLWQAQQQLALKRGPSTPAELVALEATVDQARAQLALARADRAGARVVAPFDGLVAQVNVGAGQAVDGTTAAAVVLVAAQPPRVEVVLGDADARQVAPHQPVAVSAASLPGQTFGGIVSRLVPVDATSPGGASYQAEVTLDGAPPLPLGTPVQVAIQVAQRDDVLLVPTAALDRPNEGPSVTLVSADGVVRRAVTVGLRNAQVAEITSGLQDGDVVLVSASPLGSPGS